MKAVIVAAGMGLRLRPRSNTMPKGLIEIDGKSLLEYSLDALDNTGIKETVIVIGFLGDLIREKIGMNYKDMKITYVSNEEYSETGSMYSFSKAKEIIGKDNIILLESDLLYEYRAIKLLLESDHENCLFVAGISGSGDEVYVCVDNEQRITDIGKNLEKEDKKMAIGEFIGISKFSGEFLNKLFAHAEEDYRNGEVGYYCEDCALAVSESDSRIYAVLCRDLIWTEIDNEADLSRAREQVYPKLSKKIIKRYECGEG
ncbi:sugar phosphate nucleotidyltransferase [Elusimicrobiota bacterium]